MSELKPDAWMVIECGCRAPDDCEDYELLFPTEEWERVKGDYKSHLEHGRAFPLYANTSAIESAVLRRVAKQVRDDHPASSYAYSNFAWSATLDEEADRIDKESAK